MDINHKINTDLLRKNNQIIDCLLDKCRIVQKTATWDLKLWKPLKMAKNSEQIKIQIFEVEVKTLKKLWSPKGKEKQKIISGNMVITNVAL